MKKYLFGSAALILLAGAANAADLPRKAPPAPVPVGYNWNGFYIGGNFSTAIGQSKMTSDGFVGTNDLNQAGFAAGGQIGYNWQFAPNWLFGVEGDIGWLGLNRTNVEWNDNILVGVKTDWYSTLRGRFGYLNGPTLFYVTGGAAFVHIRDTMGGNLINLNPVENTTTKTGFAIGGGIETKLSRAWSATTEYLFIDPGNTSFTANPFGIPTTTTFDHSFHVIKTGLNYKIGEPFFEGLPLIGTSSRLPTNHNWGGFYAGVNVGGGISNVHTLGGGGTVLSGSEQDVNGAGFAGGGHVGYNLMNVWGQWFVGVEGDIGYLGINRSERDWNDAVIFSEKTNWYSTVRGRVGTSTGPALLYMTAGGAWVNFTDGITTVAGLSDVSSKTGGGWTIGGGAEVALDSRWSARLESLYIDAGHVNHGIGGTAFNADFKERFTVVRAGLTYQFGGGDVVTTKY